MSDKIKELAEEAGFDNTIPIFDANSKVWQFKTFDIEKFANLIIQECIDAIDDGSGSLSSIAEHSWRQICVDEIKNKWKD